MSYGNVYVARIAMGAKDDQTLRAILEAEAYDGPSLIIAYSHCEMQGIKMATALHDQKAAVESGQWLLYRYNPDAPPMARTRSRSTRGRRSCRSSEYMNMENRFRMLELTHPDRAAELFEEAQGDVQTRWALYEYLASRQFGNGGNGNGAH